MNDHTTAADDELVSAYLDGEATADERARVENDPALQLRLREFREVAHQVATPSFFDSPERDRLIAEALRIGNQADDANNVVSMTARWQNPLTARFLPALAAAAAICLVAAGALGSLASRDSSDNVAINATETSLEADEFIPVEDEMSAGAEAAAESIEETGIEAVDPDMADPEYATTDASTSPTGEEASDQDANTSNRSDPPAELGSFGEPADAATALDGIIESVLAEARAVDDETAIGGDGTVAYFDDSSIDSCLADVMVADPEVTFLRWSGRYDLAGEAHLVFLFDLDQSLGVNGRFRLYDLVLGSCQQPGPGDTRF